MVADWAMPQTVSDSATLAVKNDLFNAMTHFLPFRLSGCAARWITTRDENAESAIVTPSPAQQVVFATM